MNSGLELFDLAAATPAWACDEAVAYTLGVAPARMALENISREPTELQNEFEKRRDLAFTAIGSGELHAINLRAVDREPYLLAERFIVWARRKYSSIAPGLETAIAARVPSVTDWKSLYEGERSKREMAEARVSNQGGTAKKLATARRIVLGMAMSSRWNYKPGEKGQKATGEQRGSIFDELRSVMGKHAPTADTIREHLDVASEDYLEDRDE